MLINQALIYGARAQLEHRGIESKNSSMTLHRIEDVIYIESKASLASRFAYIACAYITLKRLRAESLIIKAYLYT